jgi:VWFA-related protein
LTCRRYRAFGATIAVIVALHLATTSAQTPRFRTGVAAVRVDALVTNGARPVAGLTAEDFEVKDNGVTQRVIEVQYESLPLNVICALDVSSSVSGEPLARLKTALTALIEALADRDRAALLTFSGAVHLHSSLTSDRPRLRALTSAMAAGGTTSFYDAAFAGLALREADNGRTMLLIFSDAHDTSSWLPARKLIAAARQADVVVYPVTIPVAPTFGRGSDSFNDRVKVADPAQRLLEVLAADSGGRVFFARDDDSLTQTFLSVLAEFRQRYVLTYEPAGVAPGGWHDVEVKLKGKSGQVRARRGYFATSLTPAPEPRKPH